MLADRELQTEITGANVRSPKREEINFGLHRPDSSMTATGREPLVLGLASLGEIEFAAVDQLGEMAAYHLWRLKPHERRVASSSAR